MSRFKYYELSDNDKKREYNPLLEFLKDLFMEILSILHIKENDGTRKTMRILYKNIKVAENRLHKMYKIKTNKVVSKEVYYKELSDICKMEMDKKQLKLLANKISDRIRKLGVANLEKVDTKNIIIEEIKKA